MKTKRLFSYFLAVTLMMSVFCAVPAQAATNSITFDGSGYDLAADMWEFTKDGEEVVDFDAYASPVGEDNGVTPHNGSKMVKLTGETGKTVELKRLFEVKPEKNYVASVWMYLTGFTDDAAVEDDGVKLSVKDGTGSLISCTYTAKEDTVPYAGQTSETGYFVMSKSAWRKMYVYVHGADANRDAVEMFLSLKGAGTVYFDDIVIEEAPLIPNGDFEGLTSDFVPAVWVPDITAANAATFSDKDSIPAYSEDTKTTYPFEGYGYTYLRTEDGRDGQHLAIAGVNKNVMMFLTSLKAGDKYKLTFDYCATKLAQKVQCQINYKTSNDNDPFMSNGKRDSSYFPALPAKVGEWVNGFEYYFTVYPAALTTTNPWMKFLNTHASNMFKIDNVKLERMEDVPTVSITKDGSSAGTSFTGGGTAKVSFTDPYAPLTRKDSVHSTNTNLNVAFIYSGTETTMLVGVYTKENNIKKLVECKVVKGKAESSTLMRDITWSSSEISANPTPDSKWCHGEVPLELETEITFGTEGDGKTYELEAFFIGDNLNPMYKTSELVYN